MSDEVVEMLVLVVHLARIGSRMLKRSGSE